MNINDIATQLLFTTVPIRGKISDTEFISGTGFIFSFEIEGKTDISIPLLITNYHVLKDIKDGYIEFNVQENGAPQLDKSVKISFDRNIVSNNKLGQLDLIAIPIANSIKELQSKGIDVFFKSVTKNMIPQNEIVIKLSAIEDLTFVGYPSGLSDQLNHLSIIRKGITATPLWNNFNGDPTFLIDGGVYPGSSGSPVFIYNKGSFATDEGITIGTRLYFVGIIFETQVHKATTFLNLGVAINSWSFYNELRIFLIPYIASMH